MTACSSIRTEPTCFSREIRLNSGFWNKTVRKVETLFTDTVIETSVRDISKGWLTQESIPINSIRSDIAELKKTRNQRHIISMITCDPNKLLIFMEEKFPQLVALTLNELTTESFHSEILNKSFHSVIQEFWLKLQNASDEEILASLSDPSLDELKFAKSAVLFFTAFVFNPEMDKLGKMLGKLWDQPLKEVLKDFCKKIPERLLNLTLKQALESFNLIEQEFQKYDIEDEMLNLVEQFHQSRDSEQGNLLIRIQNVHLQRLGMNDFQNVKSFVWR